MGIVLAVGLLLPLRHLGGRGHIVVTRSDIRVVFPAVLRERLDLDWSMVARVGAYPVGEGYALNGRLGLYPLDIVFVRDVPIQSRWDYLILSPSLEFRANGVWPLPGVTSRTDRIALGIDNEAERDQLVATINSAARLAGS